MTASSSSSSCIFRTARPHTYTHTLAHKGDPSQSDTINIGGVPGRGGRKRGIRERRENSKKGRKAVGERKRRADKDFFPRVHTLHSEQSLSSSPAPVF